MSYNNGDHVHVLSNIFGEVVYGYTGVLLFREWNFEEHELFEHKWLVQTREGTIYNIDVTKTLVVPADTFQGSACTAEELCEKIGISLDNVEHLRGLNAFHNVHIDFNAKKVRITTTKNQIVILPLTDEQRNAIQQKVDGANILTKIKRTDNIFIASVRAAEAARILAGMAQNKASASSAGATKNNELPSLFIQFDYK